MVPTIGRIVHYIAQSGRQTAADTANELLRSEHYAAIIVHVWSDTCVNLDVRPKGMALDAERAGVKTSVMLCEDADRGGTWHWPEQVAPAAPANRQAGS